MGNSLITKKSKNIKSYSLSQEKIGEKFEIIEQNDDYVILQHQHKKILKADGKYYFSPKGFQIEKVLGSGYFGIVLLLKEVKTKKLVAYKIGYYDDDKPFIFNDGFLQITTLKKIDKDIHVPKLIGITPDGFLMEYLKNYSTITDYIKLLNEKNINPNQIKIPKKFITKQKSKSTFHNNNSLKKYDKIVSILVQYVNHINDEIYKKYGIRHKDLHLENVMIKTSRDLKEIKNVKIIDWGATVDNENEELYKNRQKRLKVAKNINNYKELVQFVNKIKN